jgi:hypothetical protein
MIRRSAAGPRQCTRPRAAGDFYLDEDLRSRLGFCHGAAGVLAIADAFALHTGLEPARRLSDHLAAFLVERLSA